MALYWIVTAMIAGVGLWWVKVRRRRKAEGSTGH